MKSLTIIFCTARKNPELKWATHSILSELDCKMTMLVIDSRFEVPSDSMTWTDDDKGRFTIQLHPVKPNVWQGKYRITKDEWWAKSAALNTGLCLAKTEWVMCIDDRCVLLPGWLKAVKEAMRGGYAVAGAYEKRLGMKVEQGRIIDAGRLTGSDPRNPRGWIKQPVMTYGNHWFGCCNALPLEWALAQGGYDESCDSLGYEDTIFGHTLCRNNRMVKYDPRLKVIQDRQMPESATLVKRTDKGISPKDKSHALEKRAAGRLTAAHDFNIRAVRDAVQRGEPFPVPTTPSHDWYDNQPLSEFGL